MQIPTEDVGILKVAAARSKRSQATFEPTAAVETNIDEAPIRSRFASLNGILKMAASHRERSPAILEATGARTFPIVDRRLVKKKRL